MLLFLFNPVVRSLRACNRPASSSTCSGSSAARGPPWARSPKPPMSSSRNGWKRSSTNSGPRSRLPRRRQGVCPPGADGRRWQRGQDSCVVGRGGLPARQERRGARRLAVPYPLRDRPAGAGPHGRDHGPTAARPTRRTCCGDPCSRILLRDGPLVRRVHPVERDRRGRQAATSAGSATTATSTRCSKSGRCRRRRGRRACSATWW